MLNRLNLSCTATQAAAPPSCHSKLCISIPELGQHQSTDPAIPTGQSKAGPDLGGSIQCRPSERFLGSLLPGGASHTSTAKGEAEPHEWLPLLALGLSSPTASTPGDLELLQPHARAEGCREQSQLHGICLRKALGWGHNHCFRQAWSD